MSPTVSSANLPKPFTRLTFLRKESVSEDTKGSVTTARKYYTQYFYLKTYSVEKRAAIFRKCINNFGSSYGSSLFSRKHWQQLKKVCWGSSVKQTRILDPWVKIETLASLVQEILETPYSKLISLGSELQQKGINLNCINPPELAEKNRKSPEVIEAFLAQAKQQKWRKSDTAEWISLMRKLFDAMDVLTFEELQVGLFNCCQKLQTLLGDRPYAIGFAKGKSTQWIAELALRHLMHAPTSSFTHASDNMSNGAVRSYQSALDPTIQNYVIFDDAAYSGQQLRAIISSFRSAVAANQPHKIYSLYIIIPFMSCHAIENLKRGALSDDALPGKVDVKIITTPRKVKAMTDVFSNDDFTRLFAIEGYRNNIWCNGHERNKCLSFMEWKVPDYNSMPKDLIIWEELNLERIWVEKDRFITNFPPPYKTDHPRR